MTNGLKKRDEHKPAVITPEIVRRYICPTATVEEIFVFLNVAKAFGLNPFKREIHLVKYGEEKAQAVIGFESFLKRAERTGMLDGWKAWTEGKPAGEEFVAKIIIYRKDHKVPFEHRVRWQEYVRHKKDGSVQTMWATKPETMLTKVVISQGFRRCFPDDLGELPYIPEEVTDITSEDLSKTEIKPGAAEGTPKTEGPEGPGASSPQKEYEEVGMEFGRLLIKLGKVKPFAKRKPIADKLEAVKCDSPPTIEQLRSKIDILREGIPLEILNETTE